jgi:hypothetical protein
MVAAKRHLQRGLDYPNREFYHGDMRVAIYRETGEVSPPGDYAAPNVDVPSSCLNRRAILTQYG